MENQDFIDGLKENGISNDIIKKMLKLKAAAEALGWEIDNYDEMDENVYITFAMSNE